MRKGLIERGQWPWEGCNTEEEDLRFFGKFCKAWEQYEWYKAEIGAGRFEAESELYPRSKNFDRFKYTMDGYYVPLEKEA